MYRYRFAPGADRAAAVLKEALADPATVKWLEDLTFGAAWSGPDDFRALAESAIRRSGPIIESAGVPRQWTQNKTARGWNPGPPRFLLA